MQDFLRFDDLSHIRRCDCTFTPDRLLLHLPKSKTDHLRQGNDVTIARTFKSTCPVVGAERYLNALADPIDSTLPIVRRLTASKKGLVPTTHGLSYTRTRETVLQAIKPLVPNIGKYGLHSLRSGGATAASNAHIPSTLISRHGRWKTNKAREAYIKPSPEVSLITSKNLGI